MAPEVLEDRGYGHETDLWSLGCIIFEMLKGETPFCATSITQLLQLIHFSKPIYPSFISKNCRNFLQRLLVNNPQKRMTWAEILDHDFIKGISIQVDDASVSPFTRPSDQLQNSKVQHSATLDRIRELKNRGHGAIEDVNVVSSRDSIQVNLNLQSDMEPETDNEEILMLKNDSDESETSGDDGFYKDDELLIEEKRPSVVQMMPGQFQNFQQFQRDAPRLHNITNYYPVAENPNMVMHRFMDNVDQELQNFILTPPPAMMMCQQMTMKHPSTSTQKATQDRETLSVRKEKSALPKAQPGLTKSQRTQSDGISTDVSSVPVETEEWLQFLFKTMQEVLDGNLETYKLENMKMIGGLLRNPKIQLKAHRPRLADYMSPLRY